ncbi:MAG: hypothetical protein AB7F23_05415 [Phycisphaerae bacterium]
MLRKIYLLVLSMAVAVSARDLHSGSWAATDSLGRKLPMFEDCGAAREGKTVAMFYFLWLGQHSTSGPWNITRIISENSEEPQWGPPHHFHHWGEPEAGYYVSDDPYIIRRHASMLSDAGVDVVIFDVTNAFTYTDVYMKLCEVYRQMRTKGNETPQIAFFTHARSPETAKKLYDDFYSKQLYPELWFSWKGKPLLLASLEGQSKEVRDFFELRDCWAWTKGKDTWNWIDRTPQGYGWHESEDKPEETSVSAASHPTLNLGRSYQNGRQPASSERGITGTEHLGLQFAEQWESALKTDPELIFVTGWNEWVAQRFITPQDGSPHLLGQPTKPGQSWFVDQYNQEFSRDIEPMKGGHGDNYYWQLVANVRRYKGVRAPNKPHSEVEIEIDGSFDDWNAANDEYFDTIGDTAHRDYKGWGALHYKDESGRNDITSAKVARDGDAVCFYVQTAEKLTPCTDDSWMLFYIDADQNPQTGRFGYDLRIAGATGGERAVEKYDAEAGWKECGKSVFSAAGKEMEMSVPKGLLAGGEVLHFDFHICDNSPTDNIADMSVYGDSAPNRRFNYRY